MRRSGAQPTCETAGVLNTVPAVVGSLQSADAIRILCGRADELSPRITTLDLWTGVIRQLRQPVAAGVQFAEFL